PKASMIEHLGMYNHLKAKIKDLGIVPDDRIAQTAPHCFDISLWQYLAGLAAGAQVSIVPDRIAHDGSQLLAYVEDAGITILEVVPSLLRVIIEELGAEASQRPQLSKLRWLIVTGEQMDPELCRRWFRMYPSIP